MDATSCKIDKRVFETVLRREMLDDAINVVDVKELNLSKKGLNFFSELFRVFVKYRSGCGNEKSMDAIVKLESSDEYNRDMARRQDMFLVELKMMRDVLPEIKKLVGRPIGPWLLYGSDDPATLVMENLTTRQFVMKCRQKGLPFDHCRQVVQLLAKLHAGSIKLYEKDPEIVESFRNGGVVSAKCPPSYLRLMEVSLLRIGREMLQWSDEKCVRAAAKLINLSKSVGRRCVEVYEYDSNEFCVLNHGDCWINNMMFKENEKGQPVDVLLLDYQMAVYASPVIDLLYFLNICPELDVRYDNDDYFLDVYLGTLRETMETIGCKRKPLTNRQLEETIHKKRIYAVFAGIVLSLRMLANPEDTETFSEALKDRLGETEMDVFKNPDAAKLAKKMIPVMDERGYLD
ncbi:uncharacterized protein LOC128896965 [Hylaeus anthracinus]|uniref:uncharacterized protein LOC128896965 n=1 Tax=Hylaeus anthracinus TaxID=313031 RepID=UPI0023B92EF8|nr:uncharacterized protein LOC128896965 [Hylaeus anthracinus]XP_054016551.1 uncharacterized protein LOC128896965 [Hylaeus anthracinus]XP_054016552.1 uncharacterized protein LOC128896965 [Hylaeus anthracinus]XP_054016553.1 uncharacterized protein LOC128896965 [Hylaeus anthracinus]